MILQQKLLTFLKTTDTWKLFGEKEAWNLFKYSAFSEAFGWTLLIYGILAGHYNLWAGAAALPLGGSVHGILFLAYLFIIISGYSSLGWTRGRAIVGVFMSIVPYGTLGFEIWAAGKRRAQQLGAFRHITVRAIILREHKVLALQLSTSPHYVLPGGELQVGETGAQALSRILQALTGFEPKFDPSPSLRETGTGLELLFTIANTAKFDSDIVAKIRQQPLVEEAKFIAQSEAGLV